MTLQTRQQIIPIHILPNIPRGKGNQTMQCSQFKEYKRETFFLKIIHNMWWGSLS